MEEKEIQTRSSITELTEQLGGLRRLMEERTDEDAGPRVGLVYHKKSRNTEKNQLKNLVTYDKARHSKNDGSEQENN